MTVVEYVSRATLFKSFPNGSGVGHIRPSISDKLLLALVYSPLPMLPEESRIKSRSLKALICLFGWYTLGLTKLFKNALATSHLKWRVWTFAPPFSGQLVMILSPVSSKFIKRTPVNPIKVQSTGECLVLIYLWDNPMDRLQVYYNFSKTFYASMYMLNRMPDTRCYSPWEKNQNV